MLLSPKSKDHSVSDILKESLIEVSDELNVNPKKCLLSQERGKKRIVMIPPRNRSMRSQQKSMSAVDVSKIQTDLNSYLRVMQGVPSAFRVANQNRELFESNVTEKLSLMNHRLDSYSEIRKATFVHKNENQMRSNEKTFKVRKNLGSLCEYVRQSRHCGKVHSKIAIDGGEGFLKIFSIVQSHASVYGSKSLDGISILRQKYAEGYHPKNLESQRSKSYPSWVR
ncbi:hypothetical protein QAD02_003428 [Eretmocerus hayati]|uniref:Uncharacterized protein n=1 Tax=Eretmocerus hayati TaxID=131215 RepID=A0ACC2NPD2_9HYME|nr:hypothetical protein QAD02_003428 [Eretmocerus hayati]